MSKDLLYKLSRMHLVSSQFSTFFLLLGMWLKGMSHNRSGPALRFQLRLLCTQLPNCPAIFGESPPPPPPPRFFIFVSSRSKGNNIFHKVFYFLFYLT